MGLGKYVVTDQERRLVEGESGGCCGGKIKRCKVTTDTFPASADRRQIDYGDVSLRDTHGGRQVRSAVRNREEVSPIETA